MELGINAEVFGEVTFIKRARLEYSWQQRIGAAEG
jgi:hypothetical protein